VPRGVPSKGIGTAQPDNAPTGYREHLWIAACTYALDPGEVKAFQRMARSDTKWGKATTGNAEVRGSLEVLDVYCNRCGVRPGREEWCPRHTSRDMDLPR
jgi:hypothetical protein